MSGSTQRRKAAATGAAPNGTRAVADVETLVSGIGPRVHQLRQELGMSLQQMAAVSEISAASIHKVERGEMVPTITTLLKIATAFARPLSYFVDDESEYLTSGSYVASGEGRPEPGPHPELGDSAAVSGPPGRFRLAGSVITVEPGAVGAAEVGQRSGEDLVHVLDGLLEVTAGTQSYALRRGDTLHVLANRPLSWSNPGKRAVKLFWVHSPAPT
jgi:transcriptional regulator with XRE-family HTH domain